MNQNVLDIAARDLSLPSCGVNDFGASVETKHILSVLQSQGKFMRCSVSFRYAELPAQISIVFSALLTFGTVFALVMIHVVTNAIEIPFGAELAAQW